jgi:hypothetical protein
MPLQYYSLKLGYNINCHLTYFDGEKGWEQTHILPSACLWVWPVTTSSALTQFCAEHISVFRVHIYRLFIVHSLAYTSAFSCRLRSSLSVLYNLVYSDNRSYVPTLTRSNLSSLT